eukprot:2899080-Pleurochrysis_carterae.AAC.2
MAFCPGRAHRRPLTARKLDVEPARRPAGAPARSDAVESAWKGAAQAARTAIRHSCAMTASNCATSDVAWPKKADAESPESALKEMAQEISARTGSMRKSRR